MTEPMIARAAETWPSPFPWLDPGIDPLRFAILERSRMDVGILETSPNRGPEIDEYLRRAFVPEPLIASGHGYWCAAWVGSMLIDAGAKVPRDFGSCDAWLPYMIGATKATLPQLAQPGDVVLYGVAGNAKHIGIIWRVTPRVLTIEGNRGLGGSASNNGVAVDVDELTRRDVLGLVRPKAVT